MYGNARNNKGKLEMNKKVKSGKCIIPFKYNGRHTTNVMKHQKDLFATSVAIGNAKHMDIVIKNRTKKKHANLREKLNCPKHPVVILLRKPSLKKILLKNSEKINYQLIKLN